MIEKLSPHYSYTTPATVHDEEALSALELVGRQGAKINEIIDDQNMLRETTEGTLGEFKNKTIPNAIEASVQEKLADGTFDDAFNQYAGDLEGRLNHLVGSVPEGSTTMDAEIIDARRGQNGVNYNNLGSAIREQFKVEHHRTRNMCMGILSTANVKRGSINIDYAAKRITVKPNIYVGQFAWYNVEQQLEIDCTTAAANPSVYALMINKTQIKLLELSQFNLDPAWVVLGNIHFDTAGIGAIYCSSTIETAFYHNGAAFADFIHSSPYEVMDARRGQNGITYANLGTAIREQFKTEHHRSRNMCMGILQNLANRVLINTVDKTITIKTGFYVGQYAWHNVSSEIVFDYSGIVSAESTYYLSVGSAGVHMGVLNTSIHQWPTDVVLCMLHMSPSVVRNIYCEHKARQLFAVNGSQYYTDEQLHNRKTANIFKKVVCCGDSYTRGLIYNKDTGVNQDKPEFSWPAFMAQLTGAEYINCGISGANAKTWLSGANGLTKAQNAGKAQAYIVGLQLNDVATGTDRYLALGSLSDIGTTADTYYGCMSRIVRELNAISPKAKIFLQTTPRSGGLYDTYNAAVRDIVAAYDPTYPVHLLDLANRASLYTGASLTGDALNGHFTAAGYEQFAEIMQTVLSDYINEHIDDFQDVAFIDYN